MINVIRVSLTKGNKEVKIPLSINTLSSLLNTDFRVKNLNPTKNSSIKPMTLVDYELFSSI